VSSTGSEIKTGSASTLVNGLDLPRGQDENVVLGKPRDFVFFFILGIFFGFFQKYSERK